MGDLLLLRGVVFSLRAGGHSVSLLAPRPGGEVLLGPLEADCLLPSDSPRFSSLFTPGGAPRDALEDLAGLDAAIAYTKSPALLQGLGVHVPRVIPWDPSPQGAVHAASWLLEPLAAMGVAARTPPPMAPTPEESREADGIAAALPRSFVAIHPGSGSASKNWPKERFLALAGALSGGEPFLLVEGPADRESCAPLRALKGAVTVRVRPRLLGAVLARSGIYVGNDSGVSHLAAAWGAPTVALFGPTDPYVWSPLGPCVRTLRGAGGDIGAIETETVLDAALALRSRAPARPCG